MYQEPAGTSRLELELDFGSLPGFLATSDRGEVDSSRYQGFKYLVVMELADRSLGTALMHERIASNEWPLAARRRSPSLKNKSSPSTRPW